MKHEKMIIMDKHETLDIEGGILLKIVPNTTELGQKQHNN